MITITYTKHNTILTENQVKIGAEKKTFLDYIHENGIEGFNAPCGGNGTCGKCRITVTSGEVTGLVENERKVLSDREIVKGVRLACQCSPLSDTTIDISLHDAESAVIALHSQGGQSVSKTSPRFSRRSLQEVPEGSLTDQRSVLTKLTDPISEPLHTNIPRNILSTVKANTTEQKDLILRDGYPQLIIDSDKRIYGVAVDIGTTTVVAYLVDLETGDVLANYSGLNAQKKFGADVISRIAFATDSDTQRDRLQQIIVKQLDGGIRKMAIDNRITLDQIVQLVIAGNTTMLHLLVGADSSGIAAAPFIPVFTDFMRVSAKELGFTSIPDISAELLPSVAAYVGADITAGIQVSGIHNDNTPSILLDIGTNGEMAFSVKDQIICCSTAAGPAFEGANITFGTGGIRGAIDTVELTSDSVSFTTIEGAEPIGICGSGIIDCVAGLIETGLVDYTGRMLTPQECDHPGIRTVEGSPVFMITPDSDDPDTPGIYLSQKDIREVQLAKSAIAAGLKTLLSDANIDESEVEHLYLAGGFGSFIRPESAGAIGLIPKSLIPKTKAIGNSSGEGAIRFSCWADPAKDILSIVKRCEYIELSGHKDFQDFYIMEMLFPMEDQ